MSTQQDINAFRAQRIANTHDPLALMANTQTPCHPDHSSLITYIQHPQPNNNFVPQYSFNTNYIPQPMQNLEDSSDPTTAMNKALALLDKAFKDMNTSQDIKMQIVDDNVGNQVRQNVVQYDGNEVGQNAVHNPSIQNVENMNGVTIVEERAYMPAKCTVKPGKRDAAYLQATASRLLKKEEAGIQKHSSGR
ncbi:hypothetical protein Tco_1320751 [Tanacetum coccineum]